VPGARKAGLAEERAGASGSLHLKYVGEAAAMFRLPGSGVVQQSGRELDASGGAGTKELAARGQRAGGPQSGGDSLCGGILPPAGSAGAGLPLQCPARIKSPNTL